MDNLLPAKMLLKGVINGLWTSLGGDADEIKNDDLPAEGLELLKGLYLHYYKDEATTKKRLAEAKNDPKYESIRNAIKRKMITYHMLNRYANLGNFFKDYENGGLAEDLKMTFGNFTVKEVEENGVRGFRIYDKYDYPNNDAWFKEAHPDIYQDFKEQGYDMSSATAHYKMAVRAGEKEKGKLPEDASWMQNLVASSYAHLHNMGGWFANENEQEEDKLNVNIFIPLDGKYASELEPDDSVAEVVLPEARPDEITQRAAIIPKGPMDSKRASVFEKVLTQLSPVSVAQAEEVKPTFKQAFAQARRDNLDIFTWNNKEYTTELKK